jgi:hypothetical protein
LTVELVAIRENAATVELDWVDVRLVTHMLRFAIRHDVCGDAYDASMMLSYALTAVAFLEAAGMASWAQTIGEEDYTLDHFRENFPITPEEHRRWRERCEAAPREAGILPAATEAPPPAAD